MPLMWETNTSFRNIPTCYKNVCVNLVKNSYMYVNKIILQKQFKDFKKYLNTKIYHFNMLKSSSY